MQLWERKHPPGLSSNLIPFCELCLEITTYSINEVFLLRMREACPNFEIS